MLSIYSCLIIKNEEVNITKLIPQLFQFSDEVHITDTGSTDNTIKNIETLQEKYHKLYLHHYTWNDNFSDARNYSLYSFDNNSDFIFWCDADDLLMDGLISKIQEIKKLNINETYDVYELKYMFNKFDPSFFHYRTSLLKTSKHFEWRDPIHEYINIDEISCKICFVDDADVYMEHQRVHSHTDRNLRIFLHMCEINYKFSSRNYYYFGCELTYVKWNVFAYNAFLSCIYFNPDFIENQLDSINSALEIYNLYINYTDSIPKYLPTHKDVLLHLYNNNVKRADVLEKLGNIFYNENDYETAEKYYLEGLSILQCPEMFSFLYNEIETHTNILLQLSCIEFYGKMGYKKCIEYNEEILTFNPDNETAKNNIKIVTNILNE